MRAYSMKMPEQTYYEQVRGFGEWPYPGKLLWVFCKRRLDIERPEVTLTARSPVEIVSELQARWIRRCRDCP